MRGRRLPETCFDQLIGKLDQGLDLRRGSCRSAWEVGNRREVPVVGGLRWEVEALLVQEISEGLCKYARIAMKPPELDRLTRDAADLFREKLAKVVLLEFGKELS